jgi:hypothetical protein
MFIGQVVDITPGATTLGVVDKAPQVSSSNKLDRNRSSGSNLFRKNAIVIVATIMLVASSRYYPECNDPWE